ncbi:efflux RND transporter periplasmic adaptor subunit [Prosthecobacter vanneervenii]|uniref:Membrane fusion protein (Multidrug efflux system) n=1 Tax=Prosthecobacter vanneervenii TaxID=48466 RepID=A0A7W7YF32_9BACT|nr:efflux RND transporter periplasmic adaptor subunit [Prosthecobacter vanneervenii]MBB5034695.1 membrane fusion protein (multidrug efflux system) [Prosthecobacter vanneervenii]
MTSYKDVLDKCAGLKAVASLSLLLSLASCGEDKTAVAPPPSKSYPVTSAVVMDVPHGQEYVASIQNSNFIELRARVSGRLEKVSADEGQRVTTGQLLFTISSHEYQEEVKRANARLKGAQAEAKMAEIDLQNNQLLLDKKIISLSEWEMSKAKLDSAMARVDEALTTVADAERRLSYAEVRAPFDGIINRIRSKTGSLIAEGDLLTSISNDGDVYAYFNVSEREYLELAKRRDLGEQGSVMLELANGEIHPHQGRIETWESVISKSTGNIAFRASFPNPEHLLKHGSTGKVILRSELKNALVIPQKCTFEVQHKTCVFALTPENSIELRSIGTKLRLQNHYVIDSGLKPSDRIIFEGIQVVKEGEVIAPDFKALAEVAPF